MEERSYERDFRRGGGEERVDGGGPGAKSKGRGGSFLPSSDSHAKQCRAHQSVATSRRRGSGKVT